VFFFVNSEHLDELKRINQCNVLMRHKEQFVGWFERKVVHALIYSGILYVLDILFDDTSPLLIGNLIT
jgi:hypothetical protein